MRTASKRIICSGMFKILLLMSVLYTVSAALALPSYAAVEIRTVRVWVGVDGYDEMQEPIIDAEAKGSGYEVEQITLTGGKPASGPAAVAEEPVEPDGQAQSENYGCEIELLADDERCFSTMEQSDIKMSGVRSECVKAVRKNGGSSLVLTVRLTGLAEVLGQIDRAVLSTDGHAAWAESVHAASYRIQLYREGEKAGLSHRTEQPEFDFSPLMTDAGSYHYKVTPLSETGKKGKPQESMPIRLSSEEAEEHRRRWMTCEYGWQSGEAVDYRYPDGLYPQSTRLELDNIPYYFDQYGRVTVRQ